MWLTDPLFLEGRLPLAHPLRAQLSHNITQLEKWNTLKRYDWSFIVELVERTEECLIWNSVILSLCSEGWTGMLRFPYLEYVFISAIFVCGSESF